MRPGVVSHLNLTGIDHGPQRGRVDRPRTVGAVDEERQPGAAVTAELRERAHHWRAGAVVNGERQLIAVPGQPGKHARWWPLGRETTRGRGATGRRENADRNTAQQRTAIYLPHISTLLLGAFPRKRPAFVVCLDFRFGATGPGGSHHRERQRSSRLELERRPATDLRHRHLRQFGASLPFRPRGRPVLGILQPTLERLAARRPCQGPERRSALQPGSHTRFR